MEQNGGMLGSDKRAQGISNLSVMVLRVNNYFKNQSSCSLDSNKQL